MPTSKHPTIKGTTRKVPPKPHSPPAAPDVAKKGRKPPRICEDIPWSPSKVVRQKLAPPDTTIDLTHLKETSPPSSSNQAFAAASMLLSLVTVPTSVAAAASTTLYHQLYSAEDNKGEQLESDDNKDEDEDDNNNEEDYVGIYKQPIDEDYDDILDMDIDSEEEFRSSFPKNQNCSKLQVKGGGQRPDVSDLSEKEAEEVIDKWRKQHKAFTDKVSRNAIRADHEMRKFEFDSREETLGDHSTHLRAMSVVNASRLSACHVFQLKDTLRLRIVERSR
jgi:hypothetical protein